MNPQAARYVPGDDVAGAGAETDRAGTGHAQRDVAASSFAVHVPIDAIEDDVAAPGIGADVAIILGDLDGAGTGADGEHRFETIDRHVAGAGACLQRGLVRYPDLEVDGDVSTEVGIVDAADMDKIPGLLDRRIRL